MPLRLMLDNSDGASKPIIDIRWRGGARACGHSSGAYLERRPVRAPAAPARLSD